MAREGGGEAKIDCDQLCEQRAGDAAGGVGGVLGLRGMAASPMSRIADAVRVRFVRSQQGHLT